MREVNASAWSWGPRTSGKYCILLASTVLLSISCPAAAAGEDLHANEATPVHATPRPDRAPAPGEKPKSFIITGSRLQRVDEIGLAPLVVVDRKEFQLTGTVDAETLLNDLPQLYPNLTAFVNNGGDGSAKLDFRGFGSADTLVLVDGRRWIPDDTSESVDINSIPVSLLDSVEVETGGGSVPYGSGAVAGTVNFRLRRLDGLVAGVTSAFDEHGDGRRSEAHLGYGSDLAAGKGHFSIFAEYLDRRPILASQRSFSRLAFLDDTANNSLIPAGSTAGPSGYFNSFTFGLGTNYDSAATFPVPGISRPFDSASDLYNYAPPNYLMVPQRRWFGNARVDYEISPAARVYGELTYVNNKTVQQLAPTPVFTGLLIDPNAVAPYLSASDLAQLQTIASFDEANFGTPPGFAFLDVHYRTVQVGPRKHTEDRHAWHALAGITGDVGPVTYDISYSYARTSQASHFTGDINQAQFDTLVSNGGCNVFGPSLLSDSCVAAISLPITDHERIHQEIGQATLSGPLFTLPSSYDPAKLVVGAEWRSMSGAYSPDPNRIFSSGSMTAPTSGHYTSEEIFGELSVPVIERAALHVLELDGGARFSHYSLSNVRGKWTWFAGGKLTPSSDVTLRGQYQQTLRAPHINELFSAASLNFPFILDPCSIYASDFSDSVRQFCIASGVPAANVFNFDPGVFQYPTTIGGNPRLKAEKGDSWNVGAEFKPRFMPGLSGSVDYFEIRQHNTVTSISGGILVDNCVLVVQDVNSPICEAVTRDTTTGEIVAIDGTVRNFGSKKTSGVDAVVDYIFPIHPSLTGAGHSKLAWHLVGTWLNKSSFKFMDDAGSITAQCAGRFGISFCGDPRPRWTWQSRLSWIDGPLTTSVRWRHTGPVRDDDPNRDFVVEHIGAYDLFDLAFEARVNDRFSVDVGANNLFNKRPPILGANANFSGGNTYPGTYDILGRDFFVSADITF